MVTQALAAEPSGAPSPGGASAQGTSRTVAGLMSQLGMARTAGSWIGSDGKPVVAVTDRPRPAGSRPPEPGPRWCGTAWINSSRPPSR